jgi:mercuric ion transport protein
MGLAVVSALLASTCCVLPLVLVLAGLGGAWLANLAPLKAWTPLFVGAALAALGAAGYLVFRRQDECSTFDGACSTTRPVMRRVFVGCAVFIGVLLLFPLAAPLFY